MAAGFRSALAGSPAAVLPLPRGFGGGVMYDGRSGDALMVAEAWRHAAREADRHEALACDPSDWFLEPCHTGRLFAGSREV